MRVAAARLPFELDRMASPALLGSDMGLRLRGAEAAKQKRPGGRSIGTNVFRKKPFHQSVASAALTILSRVAALETPALARRHVEGSHLRASLARSAANALAASTGCMGGGSGCNLFTSGLIQGTSNSRSFATCVWPSFTNNGASDLSITAAI